MHEQETPDSSSHLFKELEQNAFVEVTNGLPFQTAAEYHAFRIELLENNVGRIPIVVALQDGRIFMGGSFRTKSHRDLIQVLQAAGIITSTADITNTTSIEEVQRDLPRAAHYFSYEVNGNTKYCAFGTGTDLLDVAQFGNFDPSRLVGHIEGVTVV